MQAVETVDAAVPSRADARNARRRTRERFLKSRLVEKGYARQLRAVARHVGAIVSGFAPGGVITDHWSKLMTALHHYSAVIEPWAKAVASRMVAEVSRRDSAAWAEHSREMGIALRVQLKSPQMAPFHNNLVRDQVTLIKSLPTGAASRIARLTTEGMTQGRRPKAIAKEIAASGEVSLNRATLIARTEVARTGFLFTMYRAIDIGSEGYIWRTAKDTDVRHSHKKMEGTFVRWGAGGFGGPTLEDGTVTHAGCIYNCRCWAEPVLPDLE